MSDIRNTDSGIFYWVVDFTVLSVTFFISWMFFSVGLGIDLFAHLTAYSIILLAFVHTCRRVVDNNVKSMGEASRKILGNGTGILIGTCLVLLIEMQLSAPGQMLAAILFSSVMAFFILGTLSPVVRKTPTVHKRSSSF